MNKERYSIIGSRINGDMTTLVDNFESSTDPIERLILEKLINAKYQYDYDVNMAAKIEYEKEMELKRKLEGIDLDIEDEIDDELINNINKIDENKSSNPRGDNENMWGSVKDDKYSNAIKDDKVNNGMMERLNAEIGFTMDLPGPDVEKIIRPFDNYE